MTYRLEKRRFRVNLRRGEGFQVRPAAEKIDGLERMFYAAWEIEEGDSSIYAGEWAWMPDFDEQWPKYPAPGWVASGDLEEITNEANQPGEHHGKD